jgi:uncharacterized protein
MRERVLEELHRIEGQYAVRVLFAVESGSRAWGFASPDSDYDVRFVYVHRRDWYLTVFESRDVIEEMLPDSLDVSGWDLRKALRLFAKGNIALNEWLGSPICYEERGSLRSTLSELIPQYFRPLSALHHYRSMAETALLENLREGEIGIKKLFYVLRPLLGCRWIERSGSQPPTEFHKLLAPPWVRDDERQWADDLLQRKAATVESAPVRLAQEQEAQIRAELDGYRSDLLARTTGPLTDSAPLDRILQLWTEPAA